MNKEEKAVVKDVVVFLRIARSLDHVTYRRMIASQEFEKLMEKLEKICNWGKKDEDSLAGVIDKITKEIEGDITFDSITTLDKKSKRIGKILAAIGGAISAGIGIMYFWHKHKKNK